MSSNSPPNSDWFISAILKDGTVGQSLLEVENELRNKILFITRLRERIAEKVPSKLDVISDLAARIGVLENTLKFRLSILSPARRGAWFRANAATSVGPFGSALLAEPVFSNFDENKSEQIKNGLVTCWNAHSLVAYPLRATETCLWKILLTLNFELFEAGDFGPWPRLEKLPEELPLDLESRSLRAFLSNVRSEYVSATQRLDECYQSLLGASQRFWTATAASARRSAERPDHEDFYDGHRTAENLRREFRNRRGTPTIKRPVGKSAQDLEALAFMGFDDFPEADALRQRYHSLALEMHPDRQGGNEARFKLLSRSYKHLIRQVSR